jgi:hypothetical protein
MPSIVNFLTGKTLAAGFESMTAIEAQLVIRICDQRKIPLSSNRSCENIGDTHAEITYDPC